MESRRGLAAEPPVENALEGAVRSIQSDIRFMLRTVPQESCCLPSDPHHCFFFLKCVRIKLAEIFSVMTSKIKTSAVPYWIPGLIFGTCVAMTYK